MYVHAKQFLCQLYQSLDLFELIVAEQSAKKSYIEIKKLNLFRVNKHPYGTTNFKFIMTLTLFSFYRTLTLLASM